MTVCVGTAVIVGVLAGVLWPRLTTLALYRRSPEGGGLTSERELSQFITSDVSFSVIGLLIGAGLGVVCWRWLAREWGWPSVLVAIGVSVLAAIVCWQVGELIGPQNFTARLAAATPGELVPIDFRLRSPSALAVWVFGSVAAMLGIATFARDDSASEQLYLPWTAKPPVDGDPPRLS